MSNVHKDILIAQLARLKADEKDIRDGITSTEQKISELAVQVHRNQGALAYNAMVAKLAEDAIAKIDSTVTEPSL